MQSISFNGCAVDQIDAVCLPVFLFFKKLLNMCSCFLGPTVFVPEPLGIQSNVAQRAVCIAEEPVVTVRLITPMRAAVVLGIFGTQTGTGVAGFAQVLAGRRSTGLRFLGTAHLARMCTQRRRSRFRISHVEPRKPSHQIRSQL